MIISKYSCSFRQKKRKREKKLCTYYTGMTQIPLSVNEFHVTAAVDTWIEVVIIGF